MKLPFPWYGNKRKVAKVVWKHFGDVPNYVEPFAGSLAVLLNRPTKPKTETVNDLDCYLANFWRALINAPNEVAKYANSPINEVDLHARHKWLLDRKRFKSKMKKDPEYFDPKIAGWWAWGACLWIGDGWCSRANYNSNKRPALCAGIGIHRDSLRQRDYNNPPPIETYLKKLAHRLRYVRVACGDFERVLGYVPTANLGLTGIFFDPPYAVDRKMLYNQDIIKLSHRVRKWCIENGDNPMLRIALCGYEGEHKMPDDWFTYKWKSMGVINGAKVETEAVENSMKERIWFSPHCLRTKKRKGFIY